MEDRDELRSEKIFGKDVTGIYRDHRRVGEITTDKTFGKTTQTVRFTDAKGGGGGGGISDGGAGCLIILGVVGGLAYSIATGGLGILWESCKNSLTRESNYQPITHVQTLDLEELGQRLLSSSIYPRGEDWIGKANKFDGKELWYDIDLIKLINPLNAGIQTSKPENLEEALDNLELLRDLRDATYLNRLSFSTPRTRSMVPSVLNKFGQDYVQILKNSGKFNNSSLEYYQESFDNPNTPLRELEGMLFNNP